MNENIITPSYVGNHLAPRVTYDVERKYQHPGHDEWLCLVACNTEAEALNVKESLETRRSLQGNQWRIVKNTTVREVIA